MVQHDNVLRRRTKKFASSVHIQFFSGFRFRGVNGLFQASSHFLNIKKYVSKPNPCQSYDAGRVMKSDACVSKIPVQSLFRINTSPVLPMDFCNHSPGTKKKQLLARSFTILLPSPFMANLYCYQCQITLLSITSALFMMPFAGSVGNPLCATTMVHMDLLMRTN